jgi:hypothetical protein
MKKTVFALLLASGLGGAAVSASADYVIPAPDYVAPPSISVPGYVPPGQVWQAGHWRWDGYRYVWIEGRYVPQGGGYAYVPPRDRDADGVPNRYDRDIDGDGVPNRFDRFPYDPYRS